jgi:hypothetical protein
LPNPTTTGPGTEVLVVATDVADVLVASDEAVVDGGADAPEFPPPQPEAATTASPKTTRHNEGRSGDVTERFC